MVCSKWRVKNESEADRAWGNTQEECVTFSRSLDAPFEQETKYSGNKIEINGTTNTLLFKKLVYNELWYS